MLQLWLSCFIFLSLKLKIAAAQAGVFGTWVQVEVGNKLVPSAYSTMISLNDGRFVLYGGGFDDSFGINPWLVNDGLWLLDLRDDPFSANWTLLPKSLSSNEYPSPLSRTDAILGFKDSTKEILMWSGFSDFGTESDLWTYSMLTFTWTQRVPRGIKTFFPWRPTKLATVGTSDTQMVPINSTHFVSIGGYNEQVAFMQCVFVIDTSQQNFTITLAPTNGTVAGKYASAFPGIRMQEGTALTIYQNKILFFGGCRGGGGCADKGINFYMVSQLDLSTNPWTYSAQASPALDRSRTDDALYWPPVNVYGLCAPANNLTFCLTGRDNINRIYPGNLNVYDPAKERWLPLDVHGTIPASRWFFAMSSHEDKIYLTGGGAEDPQYFNDVYVFLAGKKVVAENIMVSQVPTTVQSNVSFSFFVDIREIGGTVSSASVPGSSWGKLLTWASNLKFQIIAMRTQPAFASFLCVEPVIIDMGRGKYKVEFTILSGSQYLLEFKYMDREVPGSPFMLNVMHGSPKGSNTIVQGNGVTNGKTVKGRPSIFKIVLVDFFGNQVTKPGFGRRLKVSILVLDENGLIGVDAAASIVETKDGFYTAAYTSPSHQYKVQVLYEDEKVFSVDINPIDSIEVSNALKTSFRVLSGLAIVVILSYSACLLAFWSRPVIRASTPKLLMLMLFGCLLGLITVMLLGEGDERFCRIVPLTGGSGFVIMLSSLLAIVWRIDRIFSNSTLNVTKIADSQLIIICASLLTFELVIDLTWLGADPLKKALFLVSDSEIQTFDACESEKTNLWNALFIGYKAVLIIFVAYYATKTRKVPSLFNEAASLAATVYSISLTCLIVAPVSLFLYEKRQVQYIILSVAIIYLMVSTPSIILIQKFFHRNENLNGNETTRKPKTNTTSSK